MKIYTKLFTLSITVTLLTGLIILGGAACKKGEQYNGNGSLGIGGDCDAMVIATVGERELTLGDLLASPQIFMNIDNLIVYEVYMQEAARREIVLTQEEIQEKVDEFYVQNGGYETFMKDVVPPSIPCSLVPDDIRKNIIMQMMQESILNNAWETDIGPITDEEVEEAWSTGKENYSNLLSQELGKEPEEVTMEDAREIIDDELKNKWMSENYQTFFEDLREDYDIENILLDRVPEFEEIVVPEVAEDTHEEEDILPFEISIDGLQPTTEETPSEDGADGVEEEPAEDDATGDDTTSETIDESGD